MLDLSTKPEKVSLLDWEGATPPMSNEAYHADKEYLSASLLIDFLTFGPAYYKDQLNPLTKTVLDSDAITLGTQMHETNLEGKLENFILMPKMKTKAERKKQGLDDSLSVAELKVEYKEESKTKGLTVVSETTLGTLETSHGRFKTNGNIEHLIEGCEVEKGYKFLHEETGVKCRVRTDLVNEENSVIIDYKTTAADINFKKLQSHTIGLKYHLKAAHYLYCLERLFGRSFQYIWLFQQSKAPFGMLVLHLSSSDKNKALSAHSRLMNTFKNHKETGFKDDFTSMKFETDLPPYAFDLGWAE